MSDGGFPVDLILLGMVAAFLVLRLRSILGRRTGFEGTPQAGGRPDRAGGPVIEGRAEPAPSSAAARPVPDPSSAIGRELGRMQALDRSLTPVRFLQGAEAAFRLIVAAFAAGDRARLRPLLSPDTLSGFEAAITAREAAGETQRSEIRAIRAAVIEQANLRGQVASIVVRFVSDQVSLTTGRDGQPVAGLDGVTEITDLWTFERDLGSRDPAWHLADARSA